MNLKFHDDENTTLLCPHCGEHYLHHYKVEMYNCAEDKKHDRITVTGCDQNNKYKLSIDQDGVNPSARRDGIRVFFVCENCGKDSALTIVQHKGETYVEWE